MLPAKELPLQQNFLIFTVPAAVSTFAMLALAVSHACRREVAASVTA
jgi:AAHS family benzoate transporter-like MFS transporter